MTMLSDFYSLCFLDDVPWHLSIKNILSGSVLIPIFLCCVNTSFGCSWGSFMVSIHLFGYARWFNFLNDNFLAGIAVSYSAPARHGCLKVVENNYCASRRGMQCGLSLSIFYLICDGSEACFCFSNLTQVLYKLNNLCFIWKIYRRCSLSIHFESHLRYHFWSSCTVSWFKPPDISEQLLYTPILVLWSCIMGIGCSIWWHCLLPEEKGSHYSWWWRIQW